MKWEASEYCICAWKEREKLTDIWFVFRILEFEINYGNFIRVTCISYVGLVEILNLQLKYKFG
jgi:hypothetical protein